jgi:hypothetical protein
MSIGDVTSDVACCLTFGREAKKHQLAGLGIDLGMGRGRAAGEPAVVGPGSEGLQSVGIELDRGTILLQGQESIGVHQHVGVGSATAAAPDAGVIRERVAVGAEQGSPGRALELKFLGPHITAAKIDVAVLESEHADHAVAVDHDVLSEAGWKLWFRRDAVEGALQMRRDLTCHFELEYVRFDPARAVEAAVNGKIGKKCGHGNTLSERFAVTPL